MLLEIHLLCVFALTVHGESTPNQENAIDLLAALNMSHHVTGVARQHSSNSVVYKLRSRAPHLTLPLEYSHFLHSSLKGGMGVYLVGHQSSRSTATVFSLSNGSAPILQIISSTLNDTLYVEYSTRGRVQGLSSFHFPSRNPFSNEEWVKLAVSLEPDRIVFFVDCQEAAVLLTKSEERVNLELPQDVVITFASTPGKKESKFNGYFKKAEISLKSYQRRPWICLNVTDDLPLHADTPNPDSQMDISQILRPSKRQAKHGPQKQTNHHPHNIQSDQVQRGTVLGPPALKVVAQAQREDRLRRLERRVEELVLMLDTVKTQNADLQTRVKYLEGCECVRQRCVWEGREMAEGQTWQIDVNTLCSCTSGKVICQANIKSGDPCLSNPCQNGGTCFILTSDPPGFHCSCPPNTKGPVCHKQQRQACWAPKPENNCETEKPVQRRWAFNPSSGLCEDFLYCSGNSSNNFPSLNACREQCMLGACCLRKPIQGQPTSSPARYVHDEYHIYANSTAWENDKLSLEAKLWYTEVNLTDKEGRLKHHKDPDFIYTCDYITLTQCQALMKDQTRGAQAVSFSPGVKCSDMRDGRGCGRFSQCKLWRYKKMLREGSKDDTCTHSTTVGCVCKNFIQRKEIRDLTLRERRLYQRAIRKLYNRPAAWKGFALLRAEFSPQAGDSTFFLPWNRYFLQLVERELQSVSSCKLAIPYFEWTVDSGSMESSAAWQAGLFGGDSDPDSGCVPHHPFQGLSSHFHWIPCLKRNFNYSVWLPDAVTLQKIINQADFQLFSNSLQTFSGLFRLWVGGHMASPLAAYDPLYLSNMAFMDKLWEQWQEKHQRETKRQTSSDFLFPAGLKMKPFDVTPDEVISFQKEACIAYVPITIGAPCNVTSFQSYPQGSPKYQWHNFNKNISHSFDSSGFDQNGYDRDGYDRSGWDRWGYGKDGYNLDFIDKDGYDISGFNRYGLNRSNVTWFDMHRDGVFENKKKTHRDKIMPELFSEEGYNIFGFDPFGLDRGGFDAFGFRVDGYDKDNCNWFFNGPHYLRIYFHTQQQLMSSSDQALTRISRTCPLITSLPPHWASQDWMTPGLVQNILKGQPQPNWVGQNESENEDTVMATIQNEKKVWLPVTPDHRFCFKLHWFSGCPLGSAPITCPDLCRGARCHGYPDAVCHLHNCGSCFIDWRDPVTGNHVMCNDW